MPAATAFAKSTPAPPWRTDFSHVDDGADGSRISLERADRRAWIASMTAITQPAPGISFARTFVMTISPMMKGRWGRSPPTPPWRSSRGSSRP